jgi:hypothetical protein
MGSICCVLAIHHERLVGELAKLQISVQENVHLKHTVSQSLGILLTGCKGAGLVGGLETRSLFWRLVDFFICRRAGVASRQTP